MMRNRKVLFGLTAFLVLLLAGTVAISGCVGKPTGPEAWPKDVAYAGGPSPTASHYLISAYWSDLLRREYGIRGTPVTSTSEESMLGIGRGDYAAGLGAVVTAEQALKGKEAFTKVGPQPVRMMMATSDLHSHIFVLKGSGITSIADLKGKKFSADYKGVTYHLWMIEEMLAAYGLSTKDIIIGPYGRAPEALSNVKDRLADAGAIWAPYNMAWIKEFAETNDVVFLPRSEAAIKRGTDKWPWLLPSKLPAGMYKGIDKDVPTVKTRIGFYANKDFPDDFVYQMMKYSYHPDYRADFEKVHPTIPTEITLESSVSMPVIPFHAGAIKFYKDMGVWTDELDKFQKDILKELGEKR